MTNRSGYAGRPYRAEPDYLRGTPMGRTWGLLRIEVGRNRPEQEDCRNGPAICYGRFTSRHSIFRSLRASVSKLQSSGIPILAPFSSRN
jgi:hypothetical protein